MNLRIEARGETIHVTIEPPAWTWVAVLAAVVAMVAAVAIAFLSWP